MRQVFSNIMMWRLGRKHGGSRVETEKLTLYFIYFKCREIYFLLAEVGSILGKTLLLGQNGHDD
jgi:hypothetical protein